MGIEFVNLKECGHGAETAVARLASWHWEQGRRVLVRAADEAAARRLDAVLWTFEPASFVPHAQSGGPDDAAEPVLIHTGAGNPNNAAVLIMTSPPPDPRHLPGGFDHVILLVPAGDCPDLHACRQCFAAAREQGLEPAHTTRLPI